MDNLNWLVVRHYRKDDIFARRSHLLIIENNKTI